MFLEEQTKPILISAICLLPGRRSFRCSGGVSVLICTVKGRHSKQLSANNDIVMRQFAMPPSSRKKLCPWQSDFLAECHSSLLSFSPEMVIVSLWSFKLKSTKGSIVETRSRHAMCRGGKWKAGLIGV